MNINETSLRRIIRKRVLLEELKSIKEQTTNEEQEEEINVEEVTKTIEEIGEINFDSFSDKKDRAYQEAYLKVLRLTRDALVKYQNTGTDLGKSLFLAAVLKVYFKADTGVSLLSGFMGSRFLGNDVNDAINSLDNMIRQKERELSTAAADVFDRFMNQKQTYEKIEELKASISDDQIIPKLFKNLSDKIVVDTADKNNFLGFDVDEFEFLKEDPAITNDICNKLINKLNEIEDIKEPSTSKASYISWAKSVINVFNDDRLTLIDIYHIDQSLRARGGELDPTCFPGVARDLGRASDDDSAISTIFYSAVGTDNKYVIDTRSFPQFVQRSNLNILFEDIRKKRIFRIENKTANNTSNVNDPNYTILDQVKLYNERENGFVVQDSNVCLGSLFFSSVQDRVSYANASSKFEKRMERYTKYAKKYLQGNKNLDKLNIAARNPGRIKYDPMAESSLLDIEDPGKFLKYLAISILRVRFIDESKIEPVKVDQSETVWKKPKAYNDCVEAQEIMNKYREEFGLTDSDRIMNYGKWEESSNNLFSDIVEEAIGKIPSLGQKLASIDFSGDNQATWNFQSKDTSKPDNRVRPKIYKSDLEELNSESRYDSDITGFNDFIVDLYNARKSLTDEEKVVDAAEKVDAADDDSVEVAEPKKTNQDKQQQTKTETPKEDNEVQYKSNRPQGSVTIDVVAAPGVNSLEEIGFKEGTTSEVIKRIVSKAPANFTGSDRLNYSVNIKLLEDDNGKPQIEYAKVITEFGQKRNEIKVFERGAIVTLKELFRDQRVLKSGITYKELTDNLQKPAGVNAVRFKRGKKRGQYWKFELVVKVGAIK